jgi:hypothetical protein
MRIHKSDIKNFPRFSFTEKDFYTDKTCFFAIGTDLLYILAYLNSSLGRYLCKRFVSILDNGGYLMQKAYLEHMPILKPEIDQIQEIKSLCKSVLNNKKGSAIIESKINKLIFSYSAFTKEEIEFIENDNFEALSR